MTDRELLELAAKAAGYDLRPVKFASGAFYHYRIDDSGYAWTPLSSDGDAFRLAVKLGLHITNSAQDAWATHLSVTAIEPIVGDALAATRRAIVRAAAEIGKSL